MASPADRHLTDTAESDGGDSERRSEGVNVEKLARDYIEGAIAYRDDVLKPQRDRLADYFDGDRDLSGDLPAREKRSKFVSRDVRDVCGAVVPQLVDALLGNEESIVEFVPRGPEDVEAATAATQYVNYLVQKHGGLELFIPVILDALKNNVGVVRYWWDERLSIEEKEYKGLTQAEIDAMLKMPEEGIEKIKVKTKTEAGMSEPPPEIPLQAEMPGMPMPESQPFVPEQLFDVTFKITRKKGEICMTAIPPEERLIDENATSLQIGKFTMWGHVRSVDIGELRAMGYDDDELDDLDSGDAFLTNEEAEKRTNAGERAKREDEETVDPSRRTVPYAELFVYGDLEDDGIPGLFQLNVGGTQCKQLDLVRVEDIDVAEFQAVPTEHVATGAAYLGNVMDVQALRTMLWRSTIDSLAQSIFPQRGFHDTAVNVADLMNDEPGALVRCKGPPQQLVTEFQHTFAGREALALIQYTDQTKEERTGVSRNSAGMDADALQSVAKDAAASVVNGAQMQIKHVARMLAGYGGMKKLFKGILRLLVKYQQFPERIRLHNGQFANFDPRQWNPDMDCIVRTGLGAGTTGETIAVLDRLGSMMKDVIAYNPEMVTPQHIYNLFQQYAKLTKFRDASQFVQLPPDTPKPPPPPSPEELLAKAQMFDSETKRRTAIEQNRNDRLKILLENDRERDKMEADVIVKLAVAMIGAKQAVDVKTVAAEAQMKIDKVRSISDYMNELMLSERSFGQQEEAEKRQQEAAAQEAAAQQAPAEGAAQ